MTPKPGGKTEPALRGLFDHAGMFPPAQKPLDEALADAASFAKRLRRPELVGADLVVAWKDWPQLAGAVVASGGFGQRPCRVALVGVAPMDLPAVVQAFLALKQRPGPIELVSLEIHIEANDAAGLLEATALPVYLEVPTFLEPRAPARELKSALPSLCQRLALLAPLGLKVRCAGPNAVDRETLATAIVCAADAKIPFKATQGLHHPVPRPGFPHGFLNVLAAVRFRQAFGATFGPEIHACLAEDDVRAFDLSDGIRWKSFHVPASRLEALPAFAIGSCSLIEPDDDLMAAFGPGGP